MPAGLVAYTMIRTLIKRLPRIRDLHSLDLDAYFGKQCRRGPV